MRLRRIEENHRDEIDLEWRSFLLRPRPSPGRTLEKFREYTKSWQRPAADSDSGNFREWRTDEGPPSHSIPPHLVAKAAARLGSAAFEQVHEALLRAYFFDSRDITTDETLVSIWRDAGLPESDFERREDPAILQAVLREHNEAQEHGATGVPAVRVEGGDGIIVGAHPYELYERWVQRLTKQE